MEQQQRKKPNRSQESKQKRNDKKKEASKRNTEILQAVQNFFQASNLTKDSLADFLLFAAGYTYNVTSKTLEFRALRSVQLGILIFIVRFIVLDADNISEKDQSLTLADLELLDTQVHGHAAAVEEYNR